MSNHGMKYKFVFRWPVNDNRLITVSNKLKNCANALIEACEAYKSGCVQIEVDEGVQSIRLLYDLLNQTKFSLVEQFDDKQELVGMSLVYRPQGNKLGPCAENNWGQDG